ncbi:hypothetical protein [Nocardioides sp. GXZ039]|uniref:hypothetical protein n=1 Tax=Nocardioides sp. GXZ039 TaxID=3136018 RepID=UPI0030F4A3D3
MSEYEALTVPARFNGPTSSGNGGWTAGAIASRLAPGPARVMLRVPPPLDVELDVVAGDLAGSVEARRGDTVVGIAAPAEAPAPVEPVAADVAREAERRYSGLTSHPFPMCFACGTGRAQGDGLRIFPGRVDDDGEGRVRVAATWTPDASLADPESPDVTTLPVAWAALDCIGGWAGDLEERLMVLGSMTAEVSELPRVGEEYVVVGGSRGDDGRKTFTASSLYTADGRLLASAEHVWFAVDPKDFL